MFQEARDKNEAAQYPVRAVRDGGASLAREAGEDIDTSWATKLGRKPPSNAGAALSPEIVIGAQVRPVHPRPSGGDRCRGGEGFARRSVYVLSFADCFCRA